MPAAARIWSEAIGLRRGPTSPSVVAAGESFPVSAPSCRTRRIRSRRTMTKFNGHGSRPPVWCHWPCRPSHARQTRSCESFGSVIANSVDWERAAYPVVRDRARPPKKHIPSACICAHLWLNFLASLCQYGVHDGKSGLPPPNPTPPTCNTFSDKSESVRFSGRFSNGSESAISRGVLTPSPASRAAEVRPRICLEAFLT